ncbi:hypothetical protein PLESTB_000814800 [Pleodorina starrii]|uniref:Uncharacterized protein n=1 Tax=Pleodorina starrii TaxID=330485 RepID=A0A9W6BKT3_9CHLO|nr:hypothetical protein PLESTM_000130400 [Pleodorina starrii]GLC54017.1 hypothetical protein PLESTB_000814800 [Pleodorina starrii]GLC64677.1 hypothetical protein PLESTF_000191500 [Pleodorina starrii]
MDWLVDGWQRRTQQKLAFAGCMAALLSLRSDPLRTTSRLRDFAQKLVGYGGAAIIFSGIQETCRAVRGHHDFLNSALSGAVTGALVVGHYQGPQYRLLGVVTWGSLGAVLHIANSVLEPRHYIEDYLIREGLLSPIAARYRQAPAQRPSSEVGLLFPEYEHRDILLAAKEIKERELRQINDRAAAATAAAARPIGDDREGDIEGDIPDDDPGYQAWLRTSGFEADVLLQSQPQQQQQQQQQQQTRQQTEQQQQLLGLAAGATGGGGEAAGESDGSGSRAGAGASGGDEAAAAPEVKARGWSSWFTPWKWRSKGASDSS